MTVAEMQPRLPYVRFETRAVQDFEATRREGRYVANNVDFVIIQPAGAKDTVEKPVDRWLQSFRNPTKPEMLQLGAQYKTIYEEWKKGNDIPLHGTPIKTWPAISPAEAEMILQANIRTVEDLAVANDFSLSRIGMGARALQQKAKSWMDTAADTGKVAIELQGLRTLVDELSKRNDELQKQLDEIKPKRGRPPKNRNDDNGALHDDSTSDNPESV